jgi:hypothetical protein
MYPSGNRKSLMLQPPCFVITLKGHDLSESLTSECLASAKKHDWKVTVYDAVNGNDVTESTWQGIGVTPLLTEYGMSRAGVQGCFLSHFALWKKCIELDTEIIILEHDALIEAPWDCQLTSKDYLVKLTQFRQKKGFREDIYSGTWSPGAIAYLISPSQAQQLVDFTITVGAIPTDVAMGSSVIQYINLNYPYVKMNKKMKDIKFSTTENL